jgi:hypothetical protein
MINERGALGETEGTNPFKHFNMKTPNFGQRVDIFDLPHLSPPPACTD